MSRRVAVRAGLGVAVSVVACLLLVQAVDLPRTGELLAAVDLRWLLLPVIVIATQFGLRSWRWATLMTAVSGRPVAAARMAPPLAIGYLGNAVLPVRLGEIARAALAARRESMPIAAVMATVVVERVVDLSALLSVGLLATGLSTALGWGGAVAALAILSAVALAARGAPLAVRAVRARLPGPFAPPIVRFLDAIHSMGSRTLGGVFVLSALGWLCDAAIVWASAMAVGVHLSPWLAFAIAVGAALGTALPAAGGYLGTYELGAVTIGVLGGVPPETILTIALVAHVVAVVPLAMAGLLVLARMTLLAAPPGLESLAAESAANRGSPRGS